MFIRVAVLSLLVFAAGFATHEVIHLAVIYAVGGQGSIIVRPWRLGLVDWSIPSLHAQPAQPLDLTRQALVNFLGPALATIPFVALLFATRDAAARAALGVNVLILGFYAAIETADLLLEARADVDLGVLTTPEFNYGVPLALILLTAALAARATAGTHAARSTATR